MWEEEIDVGVLWWSRGEERAHAQSDTTIWFAYSAPVPTLWRYWSSRRALQRLLNWLFAGCKISCSRRYREDSLEGSWWASRRWKQWTSSSQSAVVCYSNKTDLSFGQSSELYFVFLGAVISGYFYYFFLILCFTDIHTGRHLPERVKATNGEVDKNEEWCFLCPLRLQSSED